MQRLKGRRPAYFVGLLLGLLTLAPAAWAQQVITNPGQVWGCVPLPNTSTSGGGNTADPASCPNNKSGVIGTGGATFQLLFAATQQGARRGCIIQNNGTHNMWVFWGPTSLATTSNSLVLVAGAAAFCTNLAGTVASDAISITGTSGDAFFALQE